MTSILKNSCSFNSMTPKYALYNVMIQVLVNAATSYSVNETARSAKVSPSTAKYTLDYLYQKSMLTKHVIGHTYQYKANLDNYLARQWKTTLTLEELDAAKIVENVLNTHKSILSILLYGSCAFGRDDENSDIDLLVIADTDSKGKKEIVSQAHGTQREINISVYTPSEWRRKAVADKIFYEKVIIDSVALYGQKPVVL